MVTEVEIKLPIERVEITQRKAADAELYRQNICRGDRVQIDRDHWIKLS